VQFEPGTVIHRQVVVVDHVIEPARSVADWSQIMLAPGYRLAQACGWRQGTALPWRPVPQHSTPTWVRR
jgi:hypothetical protein